MESRLLTIYDPPSQESRLRALDEEIRQADEEYAEALKEASEYRRRHRQTGGPSF